MYVHHQGPRRTEFTIPFKVKYDVILLALQDYFSVCTFVCQASFKDSLSEVPGTRCIYCTNKARGKLWGLVFFFMFALFFPLCKSIVLSGTLFTVAFNRLTL